MLNVDQIMPELYAKTNILTKLQVEQLEWCYNLWSNSADQYEWFKLAQTICPSLTFEQFDKGWQYRNLNVRDFDHSQNEFLQILIGWY